MILGRCQLALAAVAAAAFFCPFAHGGETRLCDGWLFSRDHATWKPVSVPHDWAIDGPFSETNDIQITKIRQDGELVEKRHTGRKA